ncbi:aminoacyl--tRNA ligase-related protein [Streptomyces sp. NPDC046727]|uniref:aminoacyl--tRNA ligase-related protein n=1 Tax=Streptomyces sp. NPDC046727 TaxID=3155373 RepID=UPI0033DD19C2
MKTLSFRLDSGLPADVRESLRKNLYWTDRAVRGVEVSDEDPATVTITCPEGTDEERLTAHVLADVATMTAELGQFPSRTVYESPGEPAAGRPAPLPPDRVLGELTARGWVSEELAGSFVYTGLMADLYYGLEHTFAETARQLGAREIHLPALLGTGTLLRSGYLADNAHAGNYVFHLHEDRELRSRFAAALPPDATEVDLGGLDTSADRPEAVLSPAACQPVFPALAGRRLTGPVRLTGYTRCYRYESGATHGLGRAREFGVREIVCAGSEAEVAAFRDELLAVCRTLLERFGLRGKVVTASDPFFIDTSARYRAFQLSFELKHEVQLDLGQGPPVAAASVNRHGDHFAQAWDIGLAGGGTAHSCCMGFGIDRWCLGVFSQFGCEVEQWPLSLRKVVAG